MWHRLIAVTLFLSSLSVYAHARVTITDFLARPDSFATFYREFVRTGFGSAFDKKDLVGSKKTLFVPSDRAFSKFGRLGLLRDSKKPKHMKRFIGYHIANGRIRRKNIIANGRGKVKTLGGGRIKLRSIRKNILYTVETDTGIIHVIDKVLIHPKLKKKFFK